MYRKYIKRILDVIGSIIAIMICIPIFLTLSVLIRIKLGKPIIFKQLRVSKDSSFFTMYKFRTMLDLKDENGDLLPNELRSTKLGGILRSTSIDELPELINILKGDISFVGPRPLLVEYLPLYTEYEMQRLKVRGGLIPPEVLHGNIAPTWEEQFEYEINYANNVSFILDMKIILATFKGVFKRNVINYGNFNRDSFENRAIKTIKKND